MSPYLMVLRMLFLFFCAMHKTFGVLIRDLIEVYVDDIVVKIKSRASLLDNLVLVFDRLHSMRTKLNSNKCVFGVTTGKLLGFLVSLWGIEANPREDQDDRRNTTSCPHERCAEAHAMPSCAKPIYI
jgi:hypothetical protein